MIVAIRVRAVAIGRRVRIPAARRGGDHQRGLRGTYRHGAALHERLRHGTPPSDSVDILRQGTGDSEHEPVTRFRSTS